MSNNIVSAKLSSSSNSFKINSVSLQKNFVEPQLLDTAIKDETKNNSIETNIERPDFIKEYTIEELMNENSIYREPSVEERYGIDYGYEDNPMSDNPNENIEYFYNDCTIWNEEDNKNGFAELTDIQYNYMASISGQLASHPEIFVNALKNKKPCYLKDITRISYMFKEEDNYFSDLSIHDVIQGKDGFVAMVLEDKAGNYTIVNTCTTTDFYNICYDLYPLLEEIGIYDDNISLKLLSELMGKNLIKEIIIGMGVEEEIVNRYLNKFSSIDELLGEIKRIYDSQNEQGALLASDYYLASYNKGVKLNFFGYSKGGGIAEYMYLTCVENYDIDFKEINKNNNSKNQKLYSSGNHFMSSTQNIISNKFCLEPNCLGKIVTYNPYHYYGLSDQDIDILNSVDYVLYRQNGDYVSTVLHENSFDDKTIAIKCDWRSMIEYTNVIGDIFNYWVFSPKMYETIYKLFQNPEMISSLRILFMDGAHRPSLASKDAYNEDGSAVSDIELATFEEISKYVLGLDDPFEVAQETYDRLNIIAAAYVHPDYNAIEMALGMGASDLGEIVELWISNNITSPVKDFFWELFT